MLPQNLICDVDARAIVETDLAEIFGFPIGWPQSPNFDERTYVLNTMLGVYNLLLLVFLIPIWHVIIMQIANARLQNNVFDQ